MNEKALVNAVRYLLENEQARLLKEQHRVSLSAKRICEISDELHEIEYLVEATKEGWEKE
jgi:hypothetical protein